MKILAALRCYTMRLANCSRRFGNLHYRNLQGIAVSDPKDGNSTFLRNAENYLVVEAMYVTAKELRTFIFLSVSRKHVVFSM